MKISPAKKWNVPKKASKNPLQMDLVALTSDFTSTPPLPPDNHVLRRRALEVSR